ncbi:Ul36-like domain-containing protein [Pandoravirus kuranda]|uniref:Ul36-like domain-containing protein n=1 Tax=Pandoravirus kuranda TaxID=3019033 RepID=A0AA95J4R7_9VIRU|nr:Ul36-like domain-containing protein [Pandoravirus kuranda]
MTTRRHNANPFARVLGATALAPVRPAAAADATPVAPQTSSGTSDVTTPPEVVAPTLTAASQRWRNYAPPVASVPETAPTTKETPEPVAPVAAPAPRHSFMSTRRLASRAPSTALLPQAEEGAPTRTIRDSAPAASTPAPVPTVTASSVGPARTPSPVPYLPLAATADARTPTTPSPCLPRAVPLCDPTPLDAASYLTRPAPTEPKLVSDGAESVVALAAALAEVARQRALVARLVAIVAADCPSCCAKVVGALVDAPVSHGVPTTAATVAPIAGTPLTTGLPQQHNHFHLSIDSRHETSRASRLRHKALGVARKSSSSSIGRRARPSTL